MSISYPKTTSHLTLEQQAVVDYKIEDILIINAYAGTGKTSTLIKFCEARLDKSILYLSYNASMKKEAELKFKHLLNVEIKTMHSLAYEALEIKEKYKDRLGSLRAIDLYVYLSEKEKEFHSFYATSLLKLLRVFCNTSLDLKAFLIQALKNPKDYEINPKLDLDYLQKKALFLWQEVQKQDCSLAYEHDFYLKAYQLSRIKLKYDYILVDEAQDINGCVIDIVLSQKAKKVFIGDTYQSIYKFRGAINSLELLAKKPKTHTLYLTQSFRCPLSIAEIANDYLKLLNAPKDFQGTLKTSISKNKKQKAFITRTNAKLFDKAVENLNQKLFLVGGVSGYNFDELLDLQYLLFKRQEYIKNAFIAKFKDLKELLSYINETKEIDLKQKIFVLFKYIHSDIKKLIKDIEKACVKDESRADLILSSCHKSKGLEWDNVELGDDFLNLKSILEENQEENIIIEKEELHLLYVALTRAKHQLGMSEDYRIDEIINTAQERIKII